MVTDLEKVPMEFHAYCLIFPTADEASLSDMANDIAINGLREPIIRLDGKILDGRCRYLACQQAGVEPRFEDYTGDTPLEFVVSKNLYRRHLNVSQRAILANDLYQLSLQSRDGKLSTLTQEDIAKQFSISRDSLQKASALTAGVSQEVKDALIGGVLSLNRASETLQQAQESVGVKSIKNATPEQRQEVQKVHKRILEDDDIPAPSAASKAAVEFNERVLQGEYDGRKFRNDIRDIQAIITQLEKIPTLYNDALGLVHCLEQNKCLSVAIVGLASSANKLKEQLRDDNTDYKTVRQALKTLQANHFKLEPHEETDKRELLQTLKNRLLDDCEKYVEHVVAIQKQLDDKHKNESKGETVSQQAVALVD